MAPSSGVRTPPGDIHIVITAPDTFSIRRHNEVPAEGSVPSLLWDVTQSARCRGGGAAVGSAAGDKHPLAH